MGKKNFIMGGGGGGDGEKEGSIGYLLLFIITAHQPGSGAVRRRELAGARARPLPSRPPFLHPYLPPHHLLLFSSHLLGETGG